MTYLCSRFRASFAICTFAFIVGCGAVSSPGELSDEPTASVSVAVLGDDAGVEHSETPTAAPVAVREIPNRPLSWFDSIWGHLRERHVLGTKSFFDRVAADHDNDGTPVAISFGPKTMVVLSDPKHITELLAEHDAKLQKGFALKFIRELVTGPGMAAIERGDEWARLHAFIGPRLRETMVRKHFGRRPARC